MEEQHLSQAEAQRRVDQIHAFQAEVAQLENEGIARFRFSANDKH